MLKSLRSAARTGEVRLPHADVRVPARAVERRRGAAILAALIPPIAAVVAWRALPNGWFVNEDFQILYEFANGTLARALFAPAFGHLDTTRNGVMGLLFAAVGPRPAPFFVVGLVVHALNAFLLYRLAARLTGQPVLASAVAVAWAITPLHHGTLEWIAAHGQVWITALVLIMLNRLAAFEQTDRRLSGGEAVLWAIALIMINTCYTGIAFLLPVAVLVIAVRRVSPMALAAMGVSVAIFAIGYLIANAVYPPVPARLGSIARPALGDALQYPAAAAAAALHLVVVPASALLLGPLFRSAAYPAWPDWIAAGTFVLVLVAGWRATARRRWLLGLLILGVSTYPLIAVGRSPLARDHPAFLALMPHYHYFAQATLALALAIALAGVRPAAPRLLVAAVLGWAAVLVASLAVRPPAVELRVADRLETEESIAQIRAAVAAAPPGSTVYIPNRPFEPMNFFALFQGDWKFPGLAGIFVTFFPRDVVDGRTVRFVATEPAELSATAGGGRIATLLVPPTPEAPARP